MPQPDLRRRLLRDAVRDNLEKTIDPGRPTATRPWKAVGAIAGLGIAATILMVVTTGRPETVVGAPPDDANATPPPRARAPERPTAPVFAQPRRLPTDVLPLEVRHVVIDPGHGGDDRGTATGDRLGDLAEKDITLDIANRLEPLLRAAGFEVTLTRRSDRTLTLRERAELANRLTADLFVSIHVNWFGARSVRGVETYYLGTTEDPDLNAFARRENRDSGYALADMRSLLEGIYADVRQDESHRLATQIQQSLHRSLLPTTPELRDRGVKTAPFVVLVATEMPAILAEVSCLSNQAEAERLARPRYREHLATALLQGIQAYAHEVNQTEEQGS